MNTPQSPKQKKIAISILNSDLLSIKNTLSYLYDIGIKYLHIDIADTTYVENITFGPAIVNEILKSKFIFDLHFMIKDPLKIIKQIKIKNTYVIIHHDIYNLNETINYIKKNGGFYGIALSPDVSVEEISHLEPAKILIMTVNPGHGSQKMIMDCVDKIEIIRKLKPNAEICVDGGVNGKTIHYVKKADYFVVGSSFFLADNQKDFYRELQNKIEL